MDSLKNLILHWINSLYDENRSYIYNITELDDEIIYYKLIEKLESWNKIGHSDNKKNIMCQFMKEEYPNVVLKNNKSNIDNLYIAILVLCRLSLEPMFHKSLCRNLSMDMQVKVKYILESIYKFGKSINTDDLHTILEDSDKADVRSQCTKPKYFLEEFLNSPVIQSMHTDNKMHEQNKELRKLRAKVEILHYEKSELVEDIKNQQKQIQELQIKLSKTLSDLKISSVHKLKINNFKCSCCKAQNIQLIQATYKQELQSIENYATELQNNNLQLQDEKNDLLNEVKIVKIKICKLEERNIKNNLILGSALLQNEKKEDEIIELKIKYEELYNYLKDKYKVCIYNESFDLDTKEILDVSLNKSETLYSVIEIQLQDTKKELIIVQNKLKFINVLFTILMEEYKKLKGKYDILYTNTIKFHAEKSLYLEQHNSIKNQFTIGKLKNDYNLVQNEIKLLFTNIYENNLPKINKTFIFLELLNISDYFKIMKRLKKNIFFKLSKEKNFFLCLLYDNKSYKVAKVSDKCPNVNVLKTFKKYIYNTMIISNEKNIPIFKNYGTTVTLNWCEQKIFFNIISISKLVELVTILEKNKIINDLSYDIDNNYDKIYLKPYWSLLPFIISNLELYLKILNTEKLSLKRNIQNTYKFNNFIQTILTHKKINFICISHDTIENDKVINLKSNKISNKVLTLNNPLNRKLLESIWVFLLKSIYGNVQIHKVLILLEKKWFFILEVLKKIIYYNSFAQQKLKQLLIKKDLIESKLKNVSFENLQILYMKFISVIQFITMVSNNYFNKMNIFNNKLLSNISLKQKIINIKKQMDNFTYLLKLYKTKLCMLNNVATIVDETTDKKKCNMSINSNKNMNIQFKYKNSDLKDKSNNTKDANIYHFDTFIKNGINYNRSIEHYIKEIHEKYELKLEKMKEKMKFVCNSQITMMKKEQEILVKAQLDDLESKIKQKCYNHTEELKKYKKHISELTKQLWHVGDKLLNEKQEKEAMINKLKIFKINYEKNENENNRSINHKLEKYNPSIIKLKANQNSKQALENHANNKICTLRGFQLMGNAFSNEDEEGEVFDTTYLSDMQKSEFCTHISNRLSILQMRNAKCKPHLKSSYSAELQFHPVHFTEEEIKTGHTSEDLFNDSLSQSLLTGKKVKWKDRTRNVTDTPQRSRRFSNIFRKHRLSTDRK